jgi:hypothetical protein
LNRRWPGHWEEQAGGVPTPVSVAVDAEHRAATGSVLQLSSSRGTDGCGSPTTPLRHAALLQRRASVTLETDGRCGLLAGLTALSVGASTLHRALGLRAEALTEAYDRQAHIRKNPGVVQWLKNLKVIVIDTVSK